MLDQRHDLIKVYKHQHELLKQLHELGYIAINHKHLFEHHAKQYFIISISPINKNLLQLKVQQLRNLNNKTIHKNPDHSNISYVHMKQHCVMEPK
jgi:hypothetical protein